MENGRKLLSSLPVNGFDREVGDRGKALDRILQSTDSEVLYEEVISGERGAIEIYIRLLGLADGYYLEYIESTLGWLARDKPRILLDILTQYKDFETIVKHGFRVSFIGMGHNVHPKAAEYVLNKRIQAISSVKNPKYREVQASCIKELKEALTDYQIKN